MRTNLSPLCINNHNGTQTEGPKRAHLHGLVCQNERATEQLHHTAHATACAGQAQRCRPDPLNKTTYMTTRAANSRKDDGIGKSMIATPSCFASAISVQDANVMSRTQPNLKDASQDCTHKDEREEREDTAVCVALPCQPRTIKAWALCWKYDSASTSSSKR